MNYFVYILRTSKNTLYVGQTNNLQKRIKEHKEKSRKSAKYLRMFPDFSLVYTDTFATRSEALKREAELKTWTKAKKERLIQSFSRCGICCTLFPIPLTKKEWSSGIYKTLVRKTETKDDFDTVCAYGGNIMRQQKDEKCIYLKDNLCSIHEKRPQSCRDFFCTSTQKKYQKMIRIIKEKAGSDTIRSC